MTQGPKKLSSVERRRREMKRQRKMAKAITAAKEALAEVLRMDRKRRHHVVWRYYLEPWSDSQGRIWCQGGGHRFKTATENVGVWNDFYELKEMSNADLLWIELIVSRIKSEEDRAFIRSWLPMFRNAFSMRDLLKKGNIVDSDIEKAIQIYISNAEEELHSSVETSALNFLPDLRRGDGSRLLSDSAYADFAFFLGLQFSRTAALQAKTLPAFKELPGVNPRAMWGPLRIIFATNIGKDLFRNREKTRIEFLECPSTNGFITGDQPIVNLGGVDHIKFLYPLSPSVSMVLTPESEAPGMATRVITQSETDEYNRKIAVASDRQIFASTEAALAPFSICTD